MKTKKHLARWLAVLLVLGFVSAYGQTSQDDPDFACLGVDQNYWVDLPNGDPNSTYTWSIISGPVGGFTEVSGQGTNHYVINFSIAGDYVLQVVETDNSVTPSCSGEPVILNITVFDAIAAPVIAENQTICYNSTPDELTMPTPPVGGNGTFTYQWQSSPDGVTWTDIAGATNSTYAPGSLTVTTYYQVVVENPDPNSCGSVTSNTVMITVLDDIVAPVIAENQTICYNSTPDELTMPTPPVGGNGTFTYQWQSSPDGVTWTDIAGATNSTYAPGSLTVTTYYQVIATATGTQSCGDVTSNAVIITVLDDIVAPVIAENQTICYNSTPDELTMPTPPVGGNGTFTYQWQSSPDGVTWTDIAGATSSTYAPGSLTVTTYYQVIATATGNQSCGDVTSNAVIITVLDDIVAPVIAENQTICFNATPDELTMPTPPVGGNGTFTYQWQSSPDGATWTDIVGATNSTYAPGSLTVTTYYQVIATATGAQSCGDVTSNTVVITVLDDVVAPVIAENQTICYNTTPDELTMPTPPVGGNGTFTYQWQSSPDGVTWTDIVGATNSTYTPGALTATTYYQVIATATGTQSCGSVTSNTVIITVNPEVVTSPIWHN